MKKKNVFKLSKTSRHSFGLQCPVQKLKIESEIKEISMMSDLSDLLGSKNGGGFNQRG